MANLFDKNQISQKGPKRLSLSQLKQIDQTTPGITQVQKAIKDKSKSHELPKLKEEMTLVQQILQEMGCGCDMKKHKTPEEIADKHGKSVKYINKQLKAGIKVEHEHTEDSHEAEVIALQHLDERPDYYEKLKKVEKVDEEKKNPCWDKYKPKPNAPFKKLDDKIVPNCVLKSSIKESYRLPAQNGQLMHILHSWRGKMMSTQLFFPAGRVPSRSEVADAINKVYPDSRLLSYRAGNLVADQPLVQVGNNRSKNYLLNNKNIGEATEKWQKANNNDNTDGMGKKAIEEYRKKHPGSKLQGAVTDPNPTGKDAERQDNYCVRSKGQMEMYNIDCKETPDKKICKSRKRWHCSKYK